MTALLDILKTLRINQWTKNLIVLAAVCFAFGDQHQTLPSHALLRALAAVALFCFASSSIYIINDLRDREADRQHPTKRFRPLAAGRIPIPLAAGLSALLMTLALLGSSRLAPAYGLLVASYIAMQVLYTFWLKHIALVDVFVIAAGFVMRAAGGGFAIHINISPWLLVCTFLLALFLALCKRRHEKILLEDQADTHRASLEYYNTKLTDQLIAIVCAATIVSYSIYTLSAETVAKFGTSLLSLTIPFVIFGIFRYLDLVYRKDAGGRPEKTLLTDVVLLVNIALYGVAVLAIFLFTRN